MVAAFDFIRSDIMAGGEVGLGRMGATVVFLVSWKG